MKRLAESFCLLAASYLVVVTLPVSALLIAQDASPFRGGIGFVVVWLPLALALAAAAGLVLSMPRIRRIWRTGRLARSMPLARRRADG